MTPESRLEQVIEWAESHGFDWAQSITWGELHGIYWGVTDGKDACEEANYADFIQWLIRTNLYKFLLIDKEFAKAVFGDGITMRLHDYSIPTSEYHLQQAIISEDMLGYYYRFIEREQGK